MNKLPDKQPEFGVETFNCPHCHAYANQRFYQPPMGPIHDLQYSVCKDCGRYTLWHFKKMIYPEDTDIQPPSADLPDGIKNDYIEASNIAHRSPRSAAALLRLCIQKLCVHLGEDGQDMDKAIANLVAKGLPDTIQQSLYRIRVIGSKAVRPGVLDPQDNIDTAAQLFEEINLITSDRITKIK